MLIRNRRSELFCLYRCLLFAGLFFTFTPGAGQEVAVSVPVADSLYHHISSERSAGWSCYFTYPQGSGAIVPNLGNNARELEKLDAFISQVSSHPDLYISRIRLTGYSSIEGSYTRNELLSYDRVEGFFLYLREHYPQLYRYPCDRAWVAEDWSGLADRVKTSRVKEREKILEIIRKIPAFDTREALLAKLSGGRVWFYLTQAIFPQLRRVELRFEFSTTPNDRVAVNRPLPTNTYNKIYNNTDIAVRTSGGVQTFAHPSGTTTQTGNDRNTYNNTGIGTSPSGTTTQTGSDRNTYNNTGIGTSPSGTTVQAGAGNEQWRANDGQETGDYNTGGYAPQASARPSRSQYGDRGSSRLWSSPPGFVFKTNLLLAAGVQSDFSYTTPVINGALEYRIDPHWSVEFGMMYSYWHHNSRLEFQGVSGYRLEPRYRLSLLNDRLGIYTGLYGRSGDYNVRRAQDAGNTGDAALPTLNYTGKYWDAGVSVGAIFKLAGGLGLEAGIRYGYVKSSPYKYIFDQEQIPQIENRWKYSKVDITDLNISLTYQFN
jgi:hypothetical protein